MNQINQYNIKLQFKSAVLVGGQPDDVADKMFKRDSKGQLYIPGHALAGAIRNLASRLAPMLGYAPCVELADPYGYQECPCLVCRLFGQANPSTGRLNNVSTLKIYHAYPTDDNLLLTTFRDGIAVDRNSATSDRAERAKYDFEVIPERAEFQFRIEFHRTLTDDEQNLINAVLEEGRHGRLKIGGEKTRGLGWVKWNYTPKVIPLKSENQIMSYLKNIEPNDGTGNVDQQGNFPEINLRSKVNTEPLPQDIYHSFVDITYHLAFDQYLLVNDIFNATRSGVDAISYREKNKFIIPGSTIKGIFRSHAEKIARTITSNIAQESDFLEHCPACHPSATGNELTACAELYKNWIKQHQINPETDLWEEAFCLSCQWFGSTYKKGLFEFTDAHSVMSEKFKIRDYLAIDRFTGGGKEHAKFDAVSLVKPMFRGNLFIENPEAWQLGWLSYIIDEINDHFAAFGSGKTNGMGLGSIEITSFKHGYMNVVNMSPIIEHESDKTPSEGAFSIHKITKPSEEQIANWKESFITKLKGFKKSESQFIPKNDSYFSSNMLRNLYPLEVSL